MKEFIGVNHGIRKIKIDESRKIDSGGYGTVYDLGNGRCAKVYDIPFPVKAKKDTKLTLKTIRNLDIKGIYKLYELLYNPKNLEFKGYVAETLQGVRLCNLTSEMAYKLLYGPIERPINILIKLETIKNNLSNNGILISDDLSSNIMVHPNGDFTIFDVDSYLVRPKEKATVTEENRDLINTTEAALPIKAARILGMSYEDIERIRQRSKEIFFDKNNSLNVKVKELSKEKSLVKTLLK